MKVKLIQVDGKLPNLALMKLKTWHNEQGDEVGFDVAEPDRVYISSIFSWNASTALGIAKMFDCEVIIGGYGVNGNTLPDEVEHCMPDYSLYGIDFSIGFTSRGCIRKCPWCDAWRKEGGIKHHADLEEFVHPSHRKVILMDNNLLASPKADLTLQKLLNRKLQVCFTQGLDLRLMTKETADILSRIDYRSLSFRERRLYVAWDHIGDEEMIHQGLKLLKDAGMKMRNIMCYMLTCFDSTLEDDFYRFNKLREWGVDPFVMRYNREGNRIYREFARWVNKRWYKSLSFEKWLRIRKVK